MALSAVLLFEPYMTVPSESMHFMGGTGQRGLPAEDTVEELWWIEDSSVFERWWLRGLGSPVFEAVE